jgi:hypothetical protein
MRRKGVTHASTMPSPPTMPNWRKPRNCVITSDAYDALAASAATSVPERVPATASTSASSTGCPRRRAST